MVNSADPDQKPTDLDLNCLQRQGISGFSMTRANMGIYALLYRHVKRSDFFLCKYREKNVLTFVLLNPDMSCL